VNGPFPDEAFGNGKPKGYGRRPRRWAFYGEISLLIANESCDHHSSRGDLSPTDPATGTSRRREEPGDAIAWRMRGRALTGVNGEE
jgi:hypothetical protein